MALRTLPRWHMHEVQGWDKLYVTDANGKSELNPVTIMLINYTMAIGIGEISNENVDDVSCRIALLEAVLGTEGGKHVTRADVVRHVGLRTEVEHKDLPTFWKMICNLNRQHNSLENSEAERELTDLSATSEDPDLLRRAVADKLAELLKVDEAGWHRAAEWLNSLALDNGFDTAARFDSAEIFALTFMDGMALHAEMQQRFPMGAQDLAHFEVAEELFWHILPHTGRD